MFNTYTNKRSVYTNVQIYCAVGSDPDIDHTLDPVTNDGFTYFGILLQFLARVWNRNKMNTVCWDDCGTVNLGNESGTINQPGSSGNMPLLSITFYSTCNKRATEGQIQERRAENCEKCVERIKWEKNSPRLFDKLRTVFFLSKCSSTLTEWTLLLC